MTAILYHFPILILTITLWHYLLFRNRETGGSLTSGEQHMPCLLNLLINTGKSLWLDRRGQSPGCWDGHALITVSCLTPCICSSLQVSLRGWERPGPPFYFFQNPIWVWFGGPSQMQINLLKKTPHILEKVWLLKSISWARFEIWKKYFDQRQSQKSATSNKMKEVNHKYIIISKISSC